MNTNTEGVEVRLRRTGVIIRFAETGCAVVRWEDGLVGIVPPDQLMPVKDPAVVALEEMFVEVVRISRLRGRKENESFIDWINRLPSDIERYMR